MGGSARALCLLLAGLAWGCGGEQRAAVPSPFGFERVVLVTLDTLRADHLGAYGYPFGTSPFLDALAARSVVFDRAYAAMPTTVPSHATMFTSLYPAQHRVLSNGLALAPGYWTLAELMAEAGYATAGFVSTRAHFAAGGLAQGFERFDEPGDAAAGELPYREASATVAAVLAWLDGGADRAPFFLWLHLFDAHQPLRPPPADRAAVAPQGPAARAERLRFLRDEQHVTLGPGPDGQAVFRRGAAGLLSLHEAYDGEVRFVDRELARLFDAFARRGLADGTLWVVTSDHGEGLGSHAYRFHGKHLYDEQVRVPLLFFSEGDVLVPRRVDALVLHVDLLPTLAELIGRADWPRAHEPRAQGRSLVPLLLTRIMHERSLRS